eukprot:scaffold34584_cov134-Amphora_coffeaeformis.AAC.1
MDLGQFVSVLMIPHFALLGQDLNCKKVQDTAGAVNMKDLKRICTRLFYGTAFAKSDMEGGMAITEKSIKALFEKHDIEDVDKELIKAMMEECPTPTSFGEALTEDVGAFDDDWKNHATTSYHDVMKALFDNHPKEASTLDNYPPEMLERKFTASFVDYMADTYRRPRYVMALWAAGVFSYVAYVWGVSDDNDWAQVSCGDSTGTQLAILGGHVSGDWGRDPDSDSSVLGGVCCLFAFYAEIENVFFNTSGNKNYDQTYVQTDDLLNPGLVVTDDDHLLQIHDEQGKVVILEEDYKAKEDPYAATYIIALIVGMGMLLALTVDLLLLVLPSNLVESTFLAPGGLKAECAQKNASFRKMSKMINGALAVHASAADDEKKPKSSQPVMYENKELQVMMSYSRGKDQKEEVGGIFWTWKKAMNGSLFYEEGVWFHSRLMAMGLAQFLVSVLIVFLAISGYANYDKFKYTETPTIAEQGESLLLD